MRHHSFCIMAGYADEEFGYSVMLTLNHYAFADVAINKVCQICALSDLVEDNLVT